MKKVVRQPVPFQIQDVEARWCNLMKARDFEGDKKFKHSVSLMFPRGGDLHKYLVGLIQKSDPALPKHELSKLVQKKFPRVTPKEIEEFGVQDTFVKCNFTSNAILKKVDGKETYERAFPMTDRYNEDTDVCWSGDLIALTGNLLVMQTRGYQVGTYINSVMVLKEGERKNFRSQGKRTPEEEAFFKSLAIKKAPPLEGETNGEPDWVTQDAAATAEKKPAEKPKEELFDY